MATAMDRLRARHAQNAAGVPPTQAQQAPAATPPWEAQQQAPAAPPAPPAQQQTPQGLGALLSQPPVQPTPAPAAPVQAPIQTPVQQTPPAPPAPPVEQALAVQTPAAIERAPLPKYEITDPALASAQLLNILGRPAEYNEAVSASMEADDAPMVSMSQPFARIKAGNWDVLKDKYDPKVYDGMPVGSRTFTAIYLGHRLGALGWQGEWSAGSTKRPSFKYVVPTHSVSATDPSKLVINPFLVDLNKATMTIGSAIVYTPKGQRAKFDLIGRINPELHIHVWTPITGFIVLIATNFKGTRYTEQQLSKIKGGMVMGSPYNFDVKLDIEINENGTAEKQNREIKIYSILPSLCNEPVGLSQVNALRELIGRDSVTTVNTINAFSTGSDFDGIDPLMLPEKLEAYNQVLGKNVFGD